VIRFDRDRTYRLVADIGLHAVLRDVVTNGPGSCRYRPARRRLSGDGPLHLGKDAVPVADIGLHAVDCQRTRLF
jgi:hypothetical protein